MPTYPWLVLVRSIDRKMARKQPLVLGAQVAKISKPNKRAGQVCVRCHDKKVCESAQETRTPWHR
jgi:cytochrome c553